MVTAAFCSNLTKAPMNFVLALEVGLWDYVAFVVLFGCLVLFLAFLVWLARLPGRIVIARREEAKGIQQQIARLGGQNKTPSAPAQESTRSDRGG